MDFDVPKLAIFMLHPLPYGFASRALVLLQCSDNKVLHLCPDSSFSAVGEVLRVHGSVHEIFHHATEDLRQLIGASYSERGDAASVVSHVESETDISQLLHEVEETQDLLDSEDDAPVIRILNALLLQAIKEGASDIHIEAYESHSAVRLRIDGDLREIATPKRELHKALISRLKIMASLDIAETRMPQDGRISTRIGNRLIDIRVSTLPNAHGERAVLRVLDKSGARLTLESAGMQGGVLAKFDALVRQPHGIVLVTGPTGSGKTTTLYSAIKRLDAQSLNIMTVEDPIEYELAGIAQTQAHPKIGLTFAAALRSILRQDPDVVMIGEIRDAETASIAIQASLTGHLVFATLHTNDASSAVTRLVDMGVEPYLLSSSLLGVLAQRLVRKCDADHPGQMRGRTGIYELLTSNAEIKQLINDGAPETEIRAAALSAGMRSMRDYGMELVQCGLTTHKEVLLATGEY